MASDPGPVYTRLKCVFRSVSRCIHRHTRVFNTRQLLHNGAIEDDNDNE